MADDNSHMQIELNGIAPLAHLGVIRVEGIDAAQFLHGQLTQDFSQLGASEARLAAFCSAKGRMQASFIGFKRSHDPVSRTPLGIGLELIGFGQCGPDLGKVPALHQN